MSAETTPPESNNAPGRSFAPPTCSAIEGLQYIADSPPREKGGFHPQTVQIAKDAILEILRLREALLLYHEAWNARSGDWRTAIRAANKNAVSVLWPNSVIERKRVAVDAKGE